MFTAGQLVAHAVGDYLLQSHWMATEKTRRTVAAVAHVTTYVLPFLFLTRDWRALAFIAVTHFVIDRWRLARYVVWAKNFLAPRRPHDSPAAQEARSDLMQAFVENFTATEAVTETGEVVQLEAGHLDLGIWYHVPMRRNWRWRDCTATGYGPDVSDWLAVWLLIIADNTLHVICNGAALWLFP